MSNSIVVSAISASVILGGSLIYSAMISQGLVMKEKIDAQPTSVITTADGHVNLGKIYSESRMMDMELTVPNGNGGVDSIFSLKGVNPDDFESVLQKKIQELTDDTNKSFGYAADDKRRLQPDDISVKKEAKLTVSTYVKYNSENIPSFTLKIMEKDFTLPANTSIHNFISSSANSVASKSKPDLDRSMMIKETVKDYK